MKSNLTFAYKCLLRDLAFRSHRGVREGGGDGGRPKRSSCGKIERSAGKGDQEQESHAEARYLQPILSSRGHLHPTDYRYRWKPL